MELIAEFNPPRWRDEVIRTARQLAEYADWLDIPDAPMGKPNYSSPVLSAFLTAIGFNVVAHLRTQDVNLIALKTITKTLGGLGVRRLLYLWGDPPAQGAPVQQVTPEQAVLYARTRPEAPEPGLILSARRTMEEIRERAGVPAGFYYVINYSWGSAGISVLEAIREIIGSRKMYVYLPVEKESEARVASMVMDVSHIIDGVVVSNPSNQALLQEALARLRSLV